VCAPKSASSGVRALGVCAAPEYAARGWRRWARYEGDAEEARARGDEESGGGSRVGKMGR
jgi:hypothetical protein